MPGPCDMAWLSHSHRSEGGSPENGQRSVVECHRGVPHAWTRSLPSNWCIYRWLQHLLAPSTFHQAPLGPVHSKNKAMSDNVWVISNSSGHMLTVGGCSLLWVCKLPHQAFPDGKENQKGSQKPTIFYPTLSFPGGNTQTQSTERTSTKSATILSTVSPSKLEHTKSKHGGHYHWGPEGP